MPVVEVAAAADVVGHRVRLSWIVVPDPGTDTVDATPRIVVRGKDLDFDFAEVVDGGTVFDSQAFPGASTENRHVDVAARPTEFTDEARIDVEVTSISQPTGDSPTLADPDLVEASSEWTESLRYTRRSVRDPYGRTVAERCELIDAGDGTGLTALIPRCYEIDVDGERTHRVVAVPTHGHGLSRRLYDLVPTAWRKHDLAPAGSGPHTDRVGVIPESRVDAGPLRRFIDLFGTGADHLRSRADGLGTLHDIERVDPRHLSHLAQLVGWEFGPSDDIAGLRHQIRYAARLYTLTGTDPGVALWVKRLTGWDVVVHEYHENVFWTNDPGGEASQTRTGSFTVDTDDAELVASLRRSNDEGDYTYDTRSTPDARYSPHTIGVFPVSTSTDSAHDVAVKIDRIQAGLDRFLPANLRLIVVLPEPTTTSISVVSLGTSDSTDGLSDPP